MTETVATPLPAATVILVRDSVVGPECFMLKRPGRGVFPDLHVFPGGKVDEEDQALCSSTANPKIETQWPHDADTCSLVAAIRECFEECGVLLATSMGNALTRHELDNARHQILSKEWTFGQFVAARQLCFDNDGIHYFSHWITPATVPARFDTRFFIATLPVGQAANNHAAETVRGDWITPEGALAKFASGAWQMIVPTLTTLRMIAGHESVAALVTCVKSGLHRIPVTPELHERGMQYNVGVWCSN